MDVKIKIDEGKTVYRTAKFTPFGNFVMASVRYKSHDYLLKEWDGDEYIRGVDEEKVYTLGRKLSGRKTENE